MHAQSSRLDRTTRSTWSQRVVAGWGRGREVSQLPPAGARPALAYLPAHGKGIGLAQAGEDHLPAAFPALNKFTAQPLALLARDGAGGVEASLPGAHLAAEELFDAVDRLPAWVAELALDLRAFLERPMAEVHERVGGRWALVDPVAVVLDQTELAAVCEPRGLGGRRGPLGFVGGSGG